VLAGLGFDTPPDRTVSRLLMPEEFGDIPELDAVVHDTPWGAQLVPASKALATAERALGEIGRGGATQRLRRGLERVNVSERWEAVLIDCPPGMTALTMNALVAAGSVLVPTQLDYLSVAGLAVLMETVEEVRAYDNPALRYLGIVGTQVDARTRHAREVRDQLEQLFGEHAGGTLCRTTIRHSTRVRDAHAAHLAVGQVFPEHPVSSDYRELADEVIVRARLGADALAGAR
jgi:chromosome partitioning protein